jgi:hypothetical protein
LRMFGTRLSQLWGMLCRVRVSAAVSLMTGA